MIIHRSIQWQWTTGNVSVCMWMHSSCHASVMTPLGKCTSSQSQWETPKGTRESWMSFHTISSWVLACFLANGLYTCSVLTPSAQLCVAFLYWWISNRTDFQLYLSNISQYTKYTNPSIRIIEIISLMTQGSKATTFFYRYFCFSFFFFLSL